MHPLLGQEMAAARMSDMHRRAERSATIKQARGAKRRHAKRTPASMGRFIPAGALRLGRSVLRLRTKPAETVAC